MRVSQALKHLLTLILLTLSIPQCYALSAGNPVAHYHINLPHGMKKITMPWPKEMLDQYQQAKATPPDTYALKTGDRAVLFTLLPIAVHDISRKTPFQETLQHSLYAAAVSMEAFFDPQGQPDSRQQVYSHIQTLHMGQHQVHLYDKSYFHQGAPFFGRTLIIPGPSEQKLLLADIYFIGYSQPDVKKQLNRLMSAIEGMRIEWHTS